MKSPQAASAANYSSVHPRLTVLAQGYHYDAPAQSSWQFRGRVPVGFKRAPSEDIYIVGAHAPVRL